MQIILFYRLESHLKDKFELVQLIYLLQNNFEGKDKQKSIRLMQIRFLMTLLAFNKNEKIIRNFRFKDNYKKN